MTKTHLGNSLLYDIDLFREELIIWHRHIKGTAYYMTLAHYGNSILYDKDTLREQLMV